jgi:hypothetical protein
MGTPFDFPASPVDGQQYTANGVTYAWSAADTAWKGQGVVKGDYLPLSGGTLSGDLTIGPGGGKFRIAGTTDVSLVSTDHAFQIGGDAALNLAFDNNEIMARNNGAAGQLYINADGGSIQLGSSTDPIAVFLASGQLKFPATQVVSADPNTIDDYERGLWTPTIVGSTGVGVGTYTTQSGRYTKVGNRVSIEANMVWTAHTGTGNIRWGGAPFTSTNVASAAACYFENITYGAGTPAVRMFSASTGGDFVLQAGGAAIASIAMDTSGSLIINVSYQVA